MPLSVQAASERAQTQMAQSSPLPAGNPRVPFRLPGTHDCDAGLGADVVRIAPGCLCRAMDVSLHGRELFRRAQHKPAIGQSSNPATNARNRITPRAYPQRDRSLDGERIQTGA